LVPAEAVVLALAVLRRLVGGNTRHPLGNILAAVLALLPLLVHEPVVRLRSVSLKQPSY
jgi:hypothetical protein